MSRPITKEVPPLDREKYLKLAERQGYSAAITQLHHDMNAIEHFGFEGPAGYQPEVFSQLKDWREFSRELWDLYRYGHKDQKISDIRR